MIVSQREAEFQQRILASSLGPIEPKLYWQMFDPEHTPAEAVDDNAVFFPTNAEEFEQMVEMWEDEAPMDEQSFARSLGFADASEA